MPAGVYLHIPFCVSRCSYCDFATDVYRDQGAVERYVKALCREISAFDESGIAIDTIYFGGGTPSLLSPSQLETIFKDLHNKFAVADGAEITLEMNPATVTANTLKEYRKLGIDRASFGVQTFDDTELRRLARGHDSADALETYRILRETGFDNVSFDLIGGLPRQTMGDWERNLEKAIALSPEHISLYLLEVHAGTPLAEQIASKRQPHPDDELAAAMYETMLQILGEAGYTQYEISNFAVKGRTSRHNSKYWRLEPVYGFGVSAHSFDGRQRYANGRVTADYLDKIESGNRAEEMREEINAASEFIFLGLRMAEGISLSAYKERFGRELSEEFSVELVELQEKKLVELAGNNLRLTRAGMLYSNEVFTYFV